MKYLGKVSDPKDLATKEYVDGKVGGATGTVTSVNNVEPSNGNITLTGGDIPMSAEDSTTLSAKIAAKQSPTQNLDAETAIADEDSFPFYDTSASANKRTLWSNIVSKLKNLFLPLTGGTMTGAITIQGTNGAVVAESPSGMDTGYRAKNTTTEKSIFFGVGAGGDNHGIYSDTAGKWLIYSDGTTTHVDNTLPLTGGTVSGNVNIVKAQDAIVSVKNSTNDVRCALEAYNGTVGLYAGHLGKWIISNNGTTTTVDNTIPATAGAVGTTNIANKAVTAAKIGSDVTYSTIGLTSSQVRTIYVGTSAPSSSTGSNGDIYLTYS